MKLVDGKHVVVEIVEFHLDLDAQGDEYAAGHCWLPEQIALFIRDIHAAYEAGGSGVKAPATEAVEQNWSARALERQISTLYYERLLSSKEKASRRAGSQFRYYNPIISKTSI